MTKEPQPMEGFNLIMALGALASLACAYISAYNHIDPLGAMFAACVCAVGLLLLPRWD